MKTNIKIILILLLSIIFISCNNDSYAQEKESIITKTINKIPQSFIGEYKHHQGETTTGTISITNDNIIINTSDINYNIDINSSDIIIKLWCNDKILDIIFIQCHKKVIIRITNWIGQGQYSNYITISKDYNVIGNFDLITNETIEVPVQEPVKEVPINNNN